MQFETHGARLARPQAYALEAQLVVYLAGAVAFGLLTWFTPRSDDAGAGAFQAS